VKLDSNPLLGWLDHCIVPIGCLWGGVAMSVDSPRSSTDQFADLPADQSEATNVSRRKALGRLGTYMAPAMLALLLSEKAAVASTSGETSDIGLKRDIIPLGRLPNGLGVYSYRYLWSDTAYVGVMAQEVESIAPDAVVRAPDGYLRVNYARLGLRLQTWDEWAAAA
jgi:hypothetical protein